MEPLEVRRGDAAGVREDVGYYVDAPFPEDVVGFRRRGAVRAFDDYVGAYVVGVVRRQNSAYRRWNQDVDV